MLSSSDMPRHLLQVPQSSPALQQAPRPAAFPWRHPGSTACMVQAEPRVVVERKPSGRCMGAFDATGIIFVLPIRQKKCRALPVRVKSIGATFLKSVAQRSVSVNSFLQAKGAFGYPSRASRRPCKTFRTGLTLSGRARRFARAISVECRRVHAASICCFSSSVRISASISPSVLFSTT